MNQELLSDLNTPPASPTISWAPPDRIFVAPDRQRKLHERERHEELVESIRQNGMIHPVLVDIDSKHQLFLIAGERRLRAAQALLAQGELVRFVTGASEKGCLPVICLTEQPAHVRARLELEENIRRRDLTWQESVRAIARVEQLLREAGEPEPAKRIAKEIEATDVTRQVNEPLQLAKHLDIPEVANAPTQRDAAKRLAAHLEKQIVAKLVQEEMKRRLADGEASAEPISRHTLIHGRCEEHLPSLGTFDVILTDPPYGVGADKYSHAGTMPTQHGYDDSARAVRGLLTHLPILLTAAAKERAHLYLFCDPSLWHDWAKAFEARGWAVFDRPLIWAKGAGPAGSADIWPMKTYETILYAVRGRRPTQGQLAGDVLSYPRVVGRQHAAQKPVALYQDLLRRSCLIGDTVLDPFCGSGTIFEAAESLSLVATGIEADRDSVALCQRRLAGEKEGA